MIPCNPVLRDTFNLLQAGEAFTNPLTTLMGSLQSGCNAGIATVTTAITALISGPTYTANLTSLNALKAKLTIFGGDPTNPSTFLTSPIGQFKAYSDFASGKIPFPAASLAGLTGSIPGIALLGAASIATAFSLTAGAGNVSSELCQAPPENACAEVLGVFGTVVGTFNASLTAIQAFLNGLSSLNLLVNASSLMAQLDAFKAAIEAHLIAAVTALAGMLLRLVNYGMSKFLASLSLDPCMASVLQAIGTPALKTALSL